jgi:hypothetical protein
MKEIALQYDDSSVLFVPATLKDRDKAREFVHNQICRAQIRGFKKERSVLQLRLFWACAQLVAENTDDQNWNTKEKVAEQCKIATQFVDTEKIVVKPNGDVHIPYRSIALENLAHMDACRFFDRAFVVMAKFLGVKPEDLKKEGEKEGGRRR